MLTVVAPCVTNTPEPNKKLVAVTSTSPVTVTTAVPPSAPPDNTKLGTDCAALKFNAPPLITTAVLLAGRASGTFTFTVAPETINAPGPLTSEPVPSVRVPPTKFNAPPAAITYTPLSVPPPPIANVPAFTLTVPPLLNAMMEWTPC